MFIQKQILTHSFRLVAVVFFTLVLCTSITAASPTDWHVMIGSPYWFGDFDAAGYSDWWWWGQSNRHPYGSHEMLSGEWGAAIYYDGITTEPKAMWLTNYFQYPDWTTNSTFTVYGTPNSWDNSSNPTQPNNDAYDHYYNYMPAYDTGQSVVEIPNKIRITIDYKVVDLGDSNYAVLPFYPQGSSTVAYAKSERYILLQTYNIKNTHQPGGSNITGLKFYQMQSCSVGSFVVSEVEPLPHHFTNRFPQAPRLISATVH